MASRPLVRGLGLAIVVVVLVGTVAVLASQDGGVPDAGARVTVDGRATVVHLDGSSELLSSGDVVRAGEEVRADAGSFSLELADGGVLEGRAGFDDARDTRVVMGDRPELVSGELLVLGDDGVDVDAAGTVVSLASDEAAARVDRGLAVRVAAYRGALGIDSAGQARSVDALRQLGIASLGRPPGSAEPIRIEETDPWDRRFLGAAMDLGRQLDAFSFSFTRNAPSDAAGRVALLSLALPEVGEEVSFASSAPPGELLVAGVLASIGSGGTVADRWDEVLAFRGEGAGWGLVATDQRVDGSTALDAVAAALSRARPTPSELAAPPATGAPGSADDVGGSGATGTTSPPGSTAPPGTTQPTSPAPTTPTTPVPTPTLPPPSPSPSPTPTIPVLPPPDEPLPDTGVDLLDTLVEPVEDLLGGLLGG